MWKSTRKIRYEINIPEGEVLKNTKKYEQSGSGMPPGFETDPLQMPSNC